MTTATNRRLKEGGGCPKCGRRLTTQGLSGAYVGCDNRHIFSRKVRCGRPGCRKEAKVFSFSFTTGLWHCWCREHEVPQYGRPT